MIKIAVVERHHGTGNIGLGMIQGFGLKEGALAFSVVSDHNLINTRPILSEFPGRSKYL